MGSLLSSLGPSCSTLENPRSEGSEAKGKGDRFPVRALCAPSQQGRFHLPPVSNCLPASREAVRLQTASPEPFLPRTSVIPYATMRKRGAAVAHRQAGGASSVQVRPLLLPGQPRPILRLLHQPVAGSGEALQLSLPGSPGLSLGHVCLQTTSDSGCELLAVPCGASLGFLAAAARAKPIFILPARCSLLKSLSSLLSERSATSMSVSVVRTRFGLFSRLLWCKSRAAVLAGDGCSKYLMFAR